MFRTYAEASGYLSSIGAKPGDPLAMPLDEARAKQDEYFRRLNGSVPPVARTIDIHIDGPHDSIPLRLAYPSNETPLPVVLFARGAGWWAGALDTHARTINQIANLTGCAVCAVDFRRTPEHHYPVQRDEVLATIRWLRDQGGGHGLRGEALVLFGESAGATLCLSAAQALRDNDEPAPAGMVLFYTNAGGPKPTARAYSQWVWQQYLGQASPAEIKSAIPLEADMRSLAPIWLGAGEDDPLKADTLLLADKLKAAGAKPSVTLYPGLPHGFVMLSGILEPAADALSQAAQAAREFIGGDALGPSHP